MIRAIYAGSFDPVTNGHLDVIIRASRIVDELVVGVLHNRAKSPLFSVEERVNMLEEVTKEYPNIKIHSFTGLLVEFAKECEAHIIVRGLRAITDFDYELQMAQTNRIMSPDLDTLFSDHQSGICLSKLYDSEGSGCLRRRYFRFRTTVRGRENPGKDA